MYNRTEQYYRMWKADKENIICTMYRNLTADLEAGYDPVGDTITKELAEIEAYKAAYKAYTEGKITARECYSILYNAY